MLRVLNVILFISVCQHFPCLYSPKKYSSLYILSQKKCKKIWVCLWHTPIQHLNGPEIWINRSHICINGKIKVWASIKKYFCIKKNSWTEFSTFSFHEILAFFYFVIKIFTDMLIPNMFQHLFMCWLATQISLFLQYDYLSQ